MATNDFRERARGLRNAVEPVAAGVYFAPEAHAAYEALGLDGSSVASDGVARPELKSYFTSRGACMAQVTGEVVAAAFGCSTPRSSCPSLAAGWQITDRDTILEARERGATAMLQRILGEQITDAGRAFREEIEVRTDELERPVLDALGDDIDELLSHLDPWSEAIIDGGSYPQRIAGVYNVGGGPHMGSGLTINSAAEQYTTKEG